MKLVYSTFALWSIFASLGSIPRLEPEVWNNIKSAGVAKFVTKRGCRRGRNKQRSIPSIQGYGNGYISLVNLPSFNFTTENMTYSTSQNMQISSKSIDRDKSSTPFKSHLIVLHEPKRRRRNHAIDSVPQPKKPCRFANFCLLNARSIRNKTSLIKDFLLDSKIDLMALTETWLQGDCDEYSVRDITPPGFTFKHVDRHSRGGGVGLLYSNSFTFKTTCSRKSLKSFECLDVTLISPTPLRVLVIYRPPPSSSNGLTCDLFFNEFWNFLELLNKKSDRVLITGDFNFHIDDNQDNNGQKFITLIDTFNLTQHVSETTHEDNHILDLIITRRDDANIIASTSVRDPGISDHFAVIAKLRIDKQLPPKREIIYRKLKDIDYSKLLSDISNTAIVRNYSTATSVTDLSDLYDSSLSSILEKHAPLKKKIVTVRPVSPWFTDEIHQLKLKKRRLERRWRRSKLQADRDLYVKCCQQLNTALTDSKMSTYCAIIDENKSDQRVLFATVDKMLHRSTEKLYPTARTTSQLANDFADFFSNKISNIRQELIDLNTAPHIDDISSISPITKFDSFSLVTETEVAKIAVPTASKSCSLDPIPSVVLKNCLHLLLPTITKIVNLSLSESVVPCSLKLAVVEPRLKKPSLDHVELKNFRPLSNLKLTSKIIEKIVAAQTKDHILNNNMSEYFQSAYKQHHSTETALTRVHNDVTRAVDNKRSVLLLLLDLSAAFDTIDHDILLSRLSERYGFCGDVLVWFTSYLSNRSQTVSVNGITSTKRDLPYGIPQGSVLGPHLFLLYTAPLADIIRHHDMCFHLYADDTQLYLSFESTLAHEAEFAKAKIETCILEINSWMSKNMLKMNNDKTELVVINARHRPSPPITAIQVCNELIEPSTTARNIGVIFDSAMTMEAQVNSMCKSAFFHLRNLAKIRKYLSKTSIEILIHAFITSRIDFCNAVLYGIPDYLLQKLQSVQNSAARLVSLTSKHDHITPVLKDLHWLPVKFRIEFKIILLTYKCLKKMAPLYLQELIKLYTPKRQLRSSSKNYLVTVQYKLRTYGYRAFSSSAPRLWNSLPDNLRSYSDYDIQSFKRHLKTHLFEKAYN